MMTREQAIEQLREQQADSFPETAHRNADAILCELLVTLGYQDVVSEYEDIGKWYS